MSLEYPESMQEFMDRFLTEESCREYISTVRWSGKFKCPDCACTKLWKLGRGVRKCVKCHRDISVTEGTVFEGTHLPLRLWFQAMWCMVSQKNGVSALGLSHALGIKREKTGWELLQKIRTAMVRSGRNRLSGTVEVDEVFLGGVKPGRRGRGALGKVLVLVAVEDKGLAGLGRIRMTIISGASAPVLRKAIELLVEPGSTIRTDEWPSYPPITQRGYKHIAIKKQPTGPGDDPTPLVHRIASLMKRWLLGTHHGRVNEEHLTSYLDEFVFRFNRRKSHSRGKLFYRLMQGMVHADQE